MLTPAPFFDFGFQAFSQNAQPSRNAGMIFGDWGFAPTSKIRLGSTQTLLATTYFSCDYLFLLYPSTSCNFDSIR